DPRIVRKPSGRVRSRYRMTASGRRLGSRHRSSFSTSRAVRPITLRSFSSLFLFVAQRPYRTPRFRGPMEYPPRVRALLDRAKADAGDTVVVQAKAGRYEGVVMPHHGFSGEDILTVKLSTGYNVGIEVREIDSIEVTAKRTPSIVQRTTRPPSKDRPTLAVLGTGGTIASYVDYRTGAVHPAVTAEEL